MRPADHHRAVIGWPRRTITRNTSPPATDYAAVDASCAVQTSQVWQLNSGSPSSRSKYASNVRHRQRIVCA